MPVDPHQCRFGVSHQPRHVADDVRIGFAAAGEPPAVSQLFFGKDSAVRRGSTVFPLQDADLALAQVPFAPQVLSMGRPIQFAALKIVIPGGTRVTLS